ncbi:collagen binding domain-containing protein, partial [Kurthia sibirica]
MKRKWMLNLFSFVLVFQLAFSTIPQNTFATENPDAPMTTALDEKGIDHKSASNDIVITDEDEEFKDDKIIIPALVEEDTENKEDITPIKTVPVIDRDNQNSKTSLNPIIKNKIEVVEKRIRKPLVQAKNNEETGPLADDSDENSASSPMIITENLLKEVTYKDKNGKTVEENHKMNVGDDITFTAKWQIPDGHHYKKNATFTFKTPKQFLISSEQYGSLIGTEGTIFGQYILYKNGIVEFTFSEEIEVNDNITGMFTVNTIIREDLVGANVQTLLVDLPMDGEFKLAIIVRPKYKVTFEKKGQTNKTETPEYIRWTIDINKHGESIGDITITDLIPKGLTLNKQSIKLYELKVTDIQGNMVEQGDEVPLLEQNLPLKIKNVDTAYRLIYDTIIDEAKTVTYKNKAEITLGNNQKIQAAASVAVVQFAPITKRVVNFDRNSRTQNWEVLFNRDAQTFETTEAYFEDYFSDTVSLVTSSFIVSKKVVDTNSNITWMNVTKDFYNIIYKKNSKGQDGFQFDFKQMVEHEYRIQYQTILKPGLQGSFKVSNSISGLGVNGAVTSTGDYINPYISKSVGLADYATKTVEWRIKINNFEVPLTNTSIVDEFQTSGLTLIEDSFKLVDSKGKVMQKDIDYSLVVFSDKLFEIHFLKPTVGIVNVSYITKFDITKLPDGKTDFGNKATLNMGVVSLNRITSEKNRMNSSEYEPKSTSTATFTPYISFRADGYSKGVYNYVTKAVTWTTGVNFQQKYYDEGFTVENNTAQGLIPRLESIQIKELNIKNGGEGVEVGGAITNYKASYKIKDGAIDKTTLVIQFTEPINRPYKIVYDADKIADLTETDYNHNAIVTGRSTPFTAKLSVISGNTYVQKTGIQSEDLINWTVVFNAAQSTLSNAVLTDIPKKIGDSPQFLIEDSFAVYEGIPNSKKPGEYLPGVAADPSLYKIIKKGDTIEVYFLSEIQLAYIIKYDAYVNVPNRASVENKVTAKAKQLSDERTTSATIKIIKTTSSGSASGDNGVLRIKKTDATNSNLGLKDTVFTLWSVDKDGKKNYPLKTVATDQNGIAEIKQLLFKKYIVVEDRASPGYLMNSTNQYDVTINGVIVDLAITNRPAIYSSTLHIKKVDINNRSKLLKNAQFRIINADSQVIEEQVTTNEEGQATVIIPALYATGEIFIIETKAPEGYKLDNIPKKITMMNNGVVHLEITNTKLDEESNGPGE